VRLVIEGSTDGLPAGVDLSIFRIVQEGLTNALKHAPRSPAVVMVRRDPGGVDIELHTTDGRGVELHTTEGRGVEPVSSGRGLVGMRERVAVFGGALDAGPTDDGGFRVHARLPLPTD